MSKQDKSLSSYLAYKNKLKDFGVNVNTLDNEDLDYNHVNNVYANGKALTNDQKKEASISLNNYLQDLQALDVKNSAVNSAENTARQSVAYQDYLNKRLGSYLGEYESATGQSGYTNLTEGNRIALQNNTMNQINQIENTKQSALSQAITNYQNSLNANGQSALDQQMTMESYLDEQRDLNYNNILGEIESKLSTNMNEDGTYKNVTTEINNYLNDSQLDEEQKTKLKNYLKFNYGYDLDENTNNNNGNNVEEIDYNGQKLTSHSSGLMDYESLLGGGTTTITINTKDGMGFTNNNTTISLDEKYSLSDIESKYGTAIKNVINKMPKGESVIIDGTLYIVTGNGIRRVQHTKAGDKLKKYLTDNNINVINSNSNEN